MTIASIILVTSTRITQPRNFAGVDRYNNLMNVVCLSSVLLKHNRSSWFLALSLPSVYRKFCCQAYWISTKIREFVYHSEHPPLCAVRWARSRTSCGYICGRWDLFEVLSFSVSVILNTTVLVYRISQCSHLFLRTLLIITKSLLRWCLYWIYANPNMHFFVPVWCFVVSVTFWFQLFLDYDWWVPVLVKAVL